MCTNCSWSCNWTDCTMNNIWNNCKNTCIQNYTCTKSCTQTTQCPDKLDAWPNPSYSVTKVTTFNWCTQESIQLSTTTASYCWDWIIQNPNDLWIKEECDDWNTDNNDLDKPSSQRCSNNCTLPHSSQPWEIWISANSICTLQNNAYANNLDTNIVYADINVEAWTNWKDVINLGTPTNFIDLSNNLANKVNNEWASSLHFTGLEINWDPSKWETQTIPVAKVKSVTPFRSCNNKLSFILWWKPIVLNNIGYHFKKPFIWELISNNWDVSLWTKLSYKLSALPKTWISDYKIWLNLKDISYLWQNIILQGTIIKNNIWNWYREFETRINSSDDATILNQHPWLQVILPTISYALNSQNIMYYLSENDYWDDKTPIKLQWNNFIGIKIIWWVQWDWKYEFTGQWKNISNLYPSDLRTEIRKWAYNYISSMTSWDIINNVKYINWNITISWDLPYETLIVKNWNVTIDWNLNPSDKKLWIIVLNDGYDVNTWYNNKWNVLVNRGVTKINAMIYADWWFISSNDYWNQYILDNVQRTNELQNQLYMNWILFTRNTIWWAQYVWWSYTLPWWTTTDEFDKAMIYDLNYIRRWNIWCSDNNLPNPDWDCDDTELWEIKEGFIIKYDSRIQTDPPKLFSK
jgi:hypothetical protein